MRNLMLTMAVALGTLSTVGCESGWDVDGQVMTAGVKDKNRLLTVYLLTARTLDPANLPAADSLYQEVTSAEQVPDDALAFKHSEFGCHQGAVMIVAWARRRQATGPEAGGANGTGATRPNRFLPGPGDLVATSDVRHPYCGMKTEFEHIKVVLTDE